MDTQVSSTSQKSDLQRKITWSRGPAKDQNLSFPDPVIHYIIKNPPTPKFYNKIIQCCKYFFEINPVLVIHHMHDGIKICSNDPEKCESSNDQCCININMKKVSCKFWITNFLSLCGINMADFVPMFEEKIFRCENGQLAILKNKVVFDDYKLLVSKFKNFSFYEIEIVHKDENAVMLDKIIGAIPKLKEFEFWFSDDITVANTSTFKKILKLKNLDNLQRLELSNVPAIFNIKDLAVFFKKHKNTKISFDFCNDISGAYKKQLNQLIDQLIKSEVPGHIIEYDGQNEEKLGILESR